MNSRIASFVVGIALSATGLSAQTVEPQPVTLQLEGDIPFLSAVGGGPVVMRSFGTLGIVSRPFSQILIDLSNSENPNVLGQISTPSRSADDWALADNLFFFRRDESEGGTHWEVYSLSNYKAPQLVDILPDSIKSLRGGQGTYSAPWLYLAAGQDGLAVLDLADPHSPELSRVIEAQDFLPAEERSSETDAHRAHLIEAHLVADGFLLVWGKHDVDSTPRTTKSFYSTVDIRTPGDPRIVDFLDLEADLAEGMLSIYDDRIFTPVNGGMDIYEVSPNGVLSKIGEIIPESRGNNWILSVAGFHGHTLFAAYFNFADFTTAPIVAYDITDIDNPRLTLGNPISKTSPLGHSAWVFVAGDTLYQGGGWLSTRDLTEEESPLKKLKPLVEVPISIGGEGSLLTVLDEFGKLSMFKIRQPDAVGVLDTEIEPFLFPNTRAGRLLRSNVANFGNYVLTNKKIFDITNPSSFQFVGPLDISIPSVGGDNVSEDDVVVRQHFAHRDGVYVLVDVQDGNASVPYLLPYAFGDTEPLEQIAAIPLATTPQAAALGDRYLVVGSGSRAEGTEAGTGRVAVYDVSVPNSPRLHGTIETGAVDAVAVENSRFYIAVIGDVGDQNIFVYDISEDGISRLSFRISLDEAFADYSDDYADIGFPDFALQAAETFLIARDGVLYGAFSQRGGKDVESFQFFPGNSIVSAFLVEPFNEPIPYYRTKTRTATPLLDAAVWEDRIMVNNYWDMIAVFQNPLPHADPDTEPRDILPEVTHDGTLAFPGEVDTYRFDALPKQEVAVTVEAFENSTLDPIVELVDGLGRLLSINDDGPQRPHALLEFTLPPEGRDFNSPFGIRVTAPSGPPNRTVGDYSITLTLGEPPAVEPTPTPTPIITAEDFELSTIQTVRRTNGTPVTFTIQVRANPERDSRGWRAKLTAEVDVGGESFLESPTIDPPIVSLPGAATLTLVPSADFLNLQYRLPVNVDVSARLILDGGEPENPIVQVLEPPILVDMIAPGQDMGAYPDILWVDTVFREPTQIYVTTTSDLSESSTDDTVQIQGRLSPFNPVVNTMDVSLDVEGVDRTETQKDAIYVRSPSGEFRTSFRIKRDDELGAGDWVVQGAFDKLNLRYNPVKGQSPKLRVPVGSRVQSSAKVAATDDPIPGVGRAVVAFGPAPNALLETGWQATYESAISILQARRFTDATLRGFCTTKGSPATVVDLQTTLATSSDADLFTLVLAGPNATGSPGSIELSNSEVLTSDQIASLIKARHDALDAAGEDGRTVVIIDTDRAGLIREEMRQNSFERFVDGPDGYVLTCTGNGQYNLSFNAMDSETGEFVSYLRFLLDAVAKGFPLGDAHEQATSSLTRFQGPLVLSYPQPIRSEMSSELRDIFLGSSFLPDPRNLPDRNAPRIVETCGNQIPEEDETPLLFVVAEDGFPLNPTELSVYAVITAPPDGVHPPAQTVVSLPYDSQTQRHELALTDFPRAQFGDTGSGDYAVGLYVKDAAGNRSTVSSLTITTLDTSVSSWGRF